MKIRNIILTVVMIAAMTLSFAGCGSKGGDEAPEVKIDYGTSELYSQEDMDSAIEKIEKAFAGWEGCELHAIRYAGDDANNKENLAWLNSLNEGSDYKELMKFVIDFHTPADAADNWEPDHEYTDYEFWLVRNEKGGWDIVSYGKG